MELKQFHTHLLAAGLEVSPLKIARKRFCFFYYFEGEKCLLTGRLKGARVTTSGGIELFTNIPAFSEITYSHSRNAWLITFEDKLLEGELKLYD